MHQNEIMNVFDVEFSTLIDKIRRTKSLHPCRWHSVGSLTRLSSMHPLSPHFSLNIYICTQKAMMKNTWNGLVVRMHTSFSSPIFVDASPAKLSLCSFFCFFVFLLLLSHIAVLQPLYCCSTMLFGPSYTQKIRRTVFHYSCTHNNHIRNNNSYKNTNQII